MKQGIAEWAHIAVASLLVCAAAILPAEAKDEIVRFQSEISRGHNFRQPIGHGLVLVLAAGDDGWTIGVSPQTVTERECGDFAGVVNTPFRNYNALYLNVSYGMTAQDAVEDSPREFNFVLSCAGLKRESTFVDRLIMSSPAGMQPTEKQVAEAEAKMGTSPQGHGKLWILDHKVSAAPEDIDGKNYGQIDWIRFRVEIRFPENADSLPVPKDFEEPGTPRHTVTGTVRDTYTHLSVEGAKVSVGVREAALGPKEPVLTGPDGRFVFKDVAEGPVNIMVEKFGFISAGMSSAPYSPSESLFTVGPAANDFEIGITRLGTISGRVVDGEETPLQGVFVYLTARELINGRRSWRWVTGQALTEKDGIYSFPSLRPGEYVVHTLLAPATAVPGGLSHEGYLPQYYPNAADFASAARLDLKGQDVRADFTLSVARVYWVSGRVKGLLDPNAFYCQFADAAGQAMTASGFQYDPATGAFAIMVPNGRWALWCNGLAGKPPDFATVRAYATREIKVENADLSGLQLELHQPVNIPINENVAHLVKIDPPTAGLAPEPDYVQEQTAILRIPPGRYRVRVGAGTCTQSIVSGGVDLLRDDLVIADGGRLPAIQVTRYSKCPTLGGTVHSQFGDSKGVVVVISDSDHIEPEIRPIYQNRFDEISLVPGAYHVYAFNTLNGLEYANLEALREYPGQTISIDKNQHATVTLELIDLR
jgi:hypothetical protein